MRVLRNRIRQARLDYQQQIGRDVTIAEVARECGISRAGLSWLEQNKTQPSPVVLVALCDYYGLTPGDLLYIDEVGDVTQEGEAEIVSCYAVECLPIAA